MVAADRKLMQQVFINVCRSSGFTLDAIRAAQVAAMAMKRHPLEIWMAMPSLEVMDEIATGAHPATKS